VIWQQTHMSAHAFERVFSCDVLEAALVWHRDHLPRHITVTEGAGWQFQLDNQLPCKLKVGDQFDVPAHMYHRLIKGDSDLKLQIVETEPTHPQM